MKVSMVGSLLFNQDLSQLLKKINMSMWKLEVHLSKLFSTTRVAIRLHQPQEDSIKNPEEVMLKLSMKNCILSHSSD